MLAQVLKFFYSREFRHTGSLSIKFSLRIHSLVSLLLMQLHVKEDLGTFPMSALTEEQTYDDYQELIDITYISCHYSSLRHTICGTCKEDVEDFKNIASHCALLCKHSNWSPDSAFSVSGPMAWNGLPVALRLTPVDHFALFLSGLKTKLLDRGRAAWERYPEGALYKTVVIIIIIIIIIIHI